MVKLRDEEFRALLIVFMCNDPSVLTPENDETVQNLLNNEAHGRGFRDWVHAYHTDMPTVKV